MAIGRISGSVLKSNLTRNGTDLAFETNLLYLDVTNSRIGIGTSEPTSTLQVSGLVTATNLVSTQNITSGANILLADNGILYAGSGNDLQIYHNGTNSYIDNSTGSLYIRDTSGGDVRIQGKSGEESLVANADGSVEIYHDNSKKIETTSTGATVFGDASIQGSLYTDTIVASTSNSDLTIDASGTGEVRINGITMPSTDGSNGQILQTNGSGVLSFADASGGGGGNNTAVRQFNYYKLDTTSAVIDQFNIAEYRGAIYDIVLEDQANGFVGHLKVSVVHDDSTPYVSTYNVNEDSTRIADFTVAMSDGMVQLSGATNTSSHTNLRIYRIALGDHHETVSNTNSKIIKTTSNIGSSATTLDQFTKTDIRGAKYVILIKDDTAGDYQISETSLTHDGTTVYHNDYAYVSSRGAPLHTFSGSISDATVTLSSSSAGNTTGTAILYRQDLGSKTKLGEFDKFLYGIKEDIDSAIETVDSFDVFQYKTARYFITLESGSEYQNSEVTMTVNNAGTDATISESFVITGNNTLATFTADVSAGKARLRASCNPNTKVYYARLAIEADNIYRANGQTSDNVYIRHNNFDLTDTQANFSGTTGSLTLPNGTTAQRPTGANGMLRYNTSLSRYEKWDGSEFVDILATTAAATDTTNAVLAQPTTGIGTTQTTIDSFSTATFDSAFYYAVTRDEINGETATERYTLVHNDSEAFVSSSNGVQSGSNDQISVNADVSAGSVRLLATGTSVVNSVSLYRIGLGDSTTTGSAGNTATILNADVDSAVEDLDTWSASTYRGAKYFISISAANGELGNVEAVVVHNGSQSFITQYNDISTGNDSLITLSTDISSGNVRLRASGNTPNLNVKMYRILLGDSETTATGDTIKTVGASSVSSSASSIDTFSTDSFTGAQYVVVAYNEAEGAASISEVMVVEDENDAYVSSGPIVSTKDSDQLTFSASLSGTTVTLSAASTSGGSTTINAFRVALYRPESGAATSEQVLITPEQTITGAKTFDSPIALTVGSDPATVADKAHIYAKDEASSAEVFVRDEAGNVTKISPHNSQGEWEYYSRNTRTGKTVRVNMEEMIRDIEKLTGKTYIKDE